MIMNPWMVRLSGYSLILLAGVALLLLPGCGGLSPMVISSDQLNAVPPGAAMSGDIMGPWGTGKFRYINAAPNGTVTIAPDGSITMTNVPVVPIAPVPVTIVPK